MNHTIWSSCGKKTRYSNEHQALHVAKAATALRGTSLKVYNCRYCNGWHLAHLKVTA